MSFLAPSSPDQESLSGSVERVTYHNEENGFCVLRVKAKGHRDVLTVTANAAQISAGEWIDAKGHWVNDKKFGVQFKATQLDTAAPTTLAGIEKYLGSGLVKGIGPHFAKKLVRGFGENVFDIIEQSPSRLLELDGIGKKRMKILTRAWSEQRAIRDIMVFLHSHDVGTSRAVRIYKLYGDDAIQVVQENPYRLALDVYGIGFKTADTIAQKVGIAFDAMIRIQAGARHALQDFCAQGNCFAWRAAVLKSAEVLLGIDQEKIELGIDLELQSEHLIEECIDGRSALFLKSYHFAENEVANHIRRLNHQVLPWSEIDVEKAIPWVEEKTKLTLSDSQKNAVATALKSKVTIITGGPGVGKTTIVNSILTILRAKKMRMALCAPTGRAAKRLSESTKMDAKTIHRLLIYEPKHNGFRYDNMNPLPIDVLVVDEASMLDLNLMHHLLKAIPDDGVLVLVGDVDQLPAVGPGAVLSDMIKSQAVTTVALTDIFRQAQDSDIIVNAHRINAGEYPRFNTDKERLSDFYFIPAETVEEIQAKVLHLVTTRVPKRFGFHASHDIQVLTPMNRGAVGTRSLNELLQASLNGHATPTVKRFGWTYAPGDKVIQLVNNYDRDVYNGDLGRIQSIDEVAQEVRIHFDGRDLVYDYGELDELGLAYATSIHKSQGSEYPVVIIPLAIQHFMMLARNLLYTAVTRGKQLVIVVGQKKALAMAVKNGRAAERLTQLDVRLGPVLSPRN